MKKEISDFGKKIDIFLMQKNIEKLKEVISEIEFYKENETLTNNELFNLYYSLGNAWAAVDRLSNKSQEAVWDFNNSDFDYSLINYRKSKSYIDENTSKEKQCQLMTNIGNAFSKGGRTIEAIRYWKLALSINSEFYMAIGNLGCGLDRYAYMMYDQETQNLIGREAYREVNRVKEEAVFPEAYDYFNKTKKKLSEYYPQEFLSKDLEVKNESFEEKTGKQIDYRKWVLENQLYLDPLNDLFNNIVCAQDVLTLPSMLVSAEYSISNPIFHSLFNTIKQEYISLRYFYYLYTIRDESVIHFSDNNRHLTDTLDYSQFGLKYEYLKISFRMAYSIFDKISYFLNNYLELNIPEDRVSFRNLWFEKSKKGKKRQINPNIVDLKNLPLRGLYFLSRDFYEKKEKYNISLEPEASNIANIRNFIEHKNCCIYWEFVNHKEGKDFSYHINETDLAKKTFSLIEKCREAIIYLSLAVNLEERKKDHELTFPFEMPNYDAGLYS